MTCKNLIVAVLLLSVFLGVDAKRSARKTEKLYRKAGKWQRKLRGVWALLGVKPFLVQPGEEGDECVLKSKITVDDAADACGRLHAEVDRQADTSCGGRRAHEGESTTPYVRMARPPAGRGTAKDDWDDRLGQFGTSETRLQGPRARAGGADAAAGVRGRRWDVAVCKPATHACFPAVLVDGDSRRLLSAMPSTARSAMRLCNAECRADCIRRI